MINIIVTRKQTVRKQQPLLLRTPEYGSVLKTAQSEIDIIFKNGCFGSEFLVADDFDAVMTVTDTDILENDTEILLEVISVMENLPSGKKSGQRHCQICSNIFPTEPRLLIYVKLKHPEKLSPKEKSIILTYSLNVFLLKSFTENSAGKLSEGEFYPMLWEN